MIRILFFPIIASVFLPSCKESNCPSGYKDLEHLFDSVSFYRTGGVHCFKDTLDLLWDEEIAFLKFPFTADISIDNIKNDLSGDVSVSEVSDNCLETQTITSAKGSEFLLSKKVTILRVSIVENTALLGSKIKIGMNRKDFYKLFLRSDFDCFNRFDHVFFYGGMADNGLTFSFRNDTLNKVTYENIPDGIPDGCNW